MLTLAWIALTALPSARPLPPMPVGPAANLSYHSSAPPAVIYEEPPGERRARATLLAFGLAGAAAMLLWTALRVERKYRSMSDV